MIVLGLDTSCEIGGAALLDENKLIAECTINSPLSHSRRLTRIIDILLNLSSIPFSSIGAFAVAIGPGSFTGLRVGLSASKGFHLATAKPLLGIPTLDAISHRVKFSKHTVCPIIDARKGEVYAAIYTAGPSGLRKSTADMVISPALLCDMINEPTLFLGNGLKTYGDYIERRLGRLAIFAPISAQKSAAAEIAELALDRFCRGDPGDGLALKPIYIRKSEAEIKWSGP